MNFKLFIVMGMSWLLEIIATIFHTNPRCWYASDGFNLLLGVFIFIIFVCKRKVLVAFQTKFGNVENQRKLSFYLNSIYSDFRATINSTQFSQRINFKNGSPSVAKRDKCIRKLDEFKAKFDLRKIIKFFLVTHAQVIFISSHFQVTSI